MPDPDRPGPPGAPGRPGAVADAATSAEPPQRLCASAQIEERGAGWLFDVLHFREPLRAFVLRIDGRVVAYLNRCVHVPTEMDWLPGQFLDSEREFIICSIHGATYEPAGGRCIGGPCGAGRLTALRVEERDGQVYWYPSLDTRPVPRPAPPPPPDESLR